MGPVMSLNALVPPWFRQERTFLPRVVLCLDALGLGQMA
jgi:hypothetical protein